MVSQATTIRNSLETNWSLTGNLSKTVSGNMREVVRFFDRPQVLGNEWPKAVTVVKINPASDENIIEHPRFSEVADVYEVNIHFRVTDVNPDTYSTAIEAIEDMGQEVWRILRLSYSPSSETGEFFVTNGIWSNQDHLDQAQPELRRRLEFRLTKIVSEEPTVYTGYGGVLTFDLSASANMDSAPGTDYIYTESNQVAINEGWDTIPYLTKDKSLFANGGVPTLQRGMFSGTFSAFVFAKKDDIDGTTAEKLEQIYRMQSNGQHIEAVFLHANNSLEAVPTTLTSQSFVKVTNMLKITDNEQLVEFNISGNLFKPSVYTVA